MTIGSLKKIERKKEIVKHSENKVLLFFKEYFPHFAKGEKEGKSQLFDRVKSFQFQGENEARKVFCVLAKPWAL